MLEPVYAQRLDYVRPLDYVRQLDYVHLGFGLGLC